MPALLGSVVCLGFFFVEGGRRMVCSLEMGGEGRGFGSCWRLVEWVMVAG